MDASLYEKINGLAGRVGAVDNIFAFIASKGPYILVAVVLLLWFWPGPSYDRERRQWGAISATIAALVSVGIDQIIRSFIWSRPRPFLDHPHHLLLAKDMAGSFPSNHAAAGFAIAVAILFYSRRAGIATLIFAALLAFSRVFTGEHYPGDVIAGAALGSVVAYGVYLARPLLAVVLERPIQLARRYHLA